MVSLSNVPAVGDTVAAIERSSEYVTLRFASGRFVTFPICDESKLDTSDTVVHKASSPAA